MIQKAAPLQEAPVDLVVIEATTDATCAGEVLFHLLSSGSRKPHDTSALSSFQDSLALAGSTRIAVGSAINRASR